MLNYKKISLGLLLLLVLASCDSNFDKETEIKNDVISLIQDEYSQIEKNTPNLTKIEYKDVGLYRDINTNYVEESGDYAQLGMINLTYYVNNNDINKIVAVFDSQKVKGLSEYFYKKGKLIFVQKIKTSNNPNDALTTKLYFKNNNLLQCGDKKIVTSVCKKEATNVLRDAIVYYQYRKD